MLSCKKPTVFADVCLAAWSLHLAGPKYRRIDKRKYEIGSDENMYENQFIYNFISRFLLVPYHTIQYSVLSVGILVHALTRIKY